MRLETKPSRGTLHHRSSHSCNARCTCYALCSTQTLCLLRLCLRKLLFETVFGVRLGGEVCGMNSVSWATSSPVQRKFSRTLVGHSSVTFGEVLLANGVELAAKS